MALILLILTIAFLVGLYSSIVQRRRQYLCLRCETISSNHFARRPGWAWLIVGPFALLWQKKMTCRTCKSNELVPVESPKARNILAAATSRSGLNPGSGSVLPTADAAIELHPNRSIGSVRVFGFFLVLLILVVLAIVFIDKASSPTSTPTATTAEPAQPTPDNSTAESAQSTPSVPAADALASDITLGLDVTGNDQKPILNVRTNLPPQTIMMASLANPIDQGGDGYFGQGKASVSANQVVQFGPFSKAGDHLSPGIYLVTVTTVGADLQPEEVQPFFGAHGERLTGRQVFTLPGTSEKMVFQKFQFKINPDGSISNPSPESAQPTPDNSTAEPAQSETMQPTAESAQQIALDGLRREESTAAQRAGTNVERPASGTPAMEPPPNQFGATGAKSGNPSTAVAKGQTTAEVLAILGPPISITTGAKHVYTYPHLTVVFTDGNVSEIHQIQ